MVSKSTNRDKRAFWLRTAWGPGFAVITSAAIAQAAPDAEPAASSNAPAVIETSKPIDRVPTKEQCVNSHRLVQQAQIEGKLVQSRDAALTCTASVCPGLIMSDCARWLNDLDQRIPSVVFEVRVGGELNFTAVVTVDDKRVEEWTRGESLRLDPGEHHFRFELAPYEPIVQNHLLAEGVHYRVVSVDFKSAGHPAALGSGAPPPTAPGVRPTARTHRPVPVIVYPLLGVGAVGIGSFTLFGLLGRSKQNNLENSCKPNCAPGDLKPMKTSYLIGDISLGVGAASLVAAGIVYFGRQEKPMTASIGITPLPGGGAAAATYSF